MVDSVDYVYDSAIVDVSQIIRSDEIKCQIVNIGDFELIKDLGSGKNGVTQLYRVTKDITLKERIPVNTLVVFKKVKTDGVELEAKRNMLVNEMRVLNKLNEIQRRVVAMPGCMYYGCLVFDSDTTEQIIVMEYIEGKNLAESSSVLNSMDLLGKFDLCLKMIDAIHFYHNHDVYHRDITLENIILKKQGEKVVPVFVDFGIACLINDVENSNCNFEFGTTLRNEKPSKQIMDDIKDTDKIYAKKTLLQATDWWHMAHVIPKIYTNKKDLLINTMLYATHVLYRDYPLSRGDSLWNTEYYGGLNVINVNNQNAVFMFDFDLTLSNGHTYGHPASANIDFIFGDKAEAGSGYTGLIKLRTTLNKIVEKGNKIIIISRGITTELENLFKANDLTCHMIYGAKDDADMFPVITENEKDHQVANTKSWALRKAEIITEIMNEYPTYDHYFMDDTPENITEAQKIEGLNTYEIKHGNMDHTLAIINAILYSRDKSAQTGGKKRR